MARERARERRGEERERASGKGFRRFLTVRRKHRALDHLSQGCDLPTLPLYPLPLMHGRERTDGRSVGRSVGGGHNGLHTLSHRDDTVSARGRIPGPLNAAEKERERCWRYEERREKKGKKKTGKRRGGYITYGDLCKIATVLRERMYPARLRS